LGKYYIILPNETPWNLESYLKKFNGIKVKEGFKYNSGTNDNWEDINSLRELIKNHVDPNFSV
jgi:hypothetical protein